MIMWTLAAAVVTGCETAEDTTVARGATVAVPAKGATATPGEPAPMPGPNGAVSAEQFDLHGTAALVRDGEVKDATQLETRINRDPDNRVDIDRDGKRDRLQVVEHHDGDDRVLEVRAIPSSQPEANPDEVGLPIATVAVERAPETAHIVVAYTDVIVEVDPVVIEFDAPIVVGSFCHWVLVVDRPVFVGVAYVVVDAHHHGHPGLHLGHHKHHKHKHHKHKRHKHKKWK